MGVNPKDARGILSGFGAAAGGLGLSILFFVFYFAVLEPTNNEVVSGYSLSMTLISILMIGLLGFASWHQYKARMYETLAMTMGLCLIEFAVVTRVGFWALAGILAPDGAEAVCRSIAADSLTPLMPGMPSAEVLGWVTSVEPGGLACYVRSIRYPAWAVDMRAMLFGQVMMTSVVGSSMVLWATMRDRIGCLWWAAPLVIALGSFAYLVLVSHDS